MKTLTLTNDARPIIFLLLLASFAAAQPSPPENSPPPPTAYGFNTRFNPSMAIIIAVLITAFFFMGFFSVYLRQCAGDSASVRAGSQVGSRGRSRRAARGLDPSVIGTFPTFEYSEVKNLKIGKGTLECAVCLNEFEDDETLRLLPKCSHVFHPECIDAWLVKRTTCPVCRANLLPGSDPEPAAAQTAEAVLDPENPAHSDDHREANENEVAITIEEDRPPAAAVAATAVPTVPNLFNPIQNRPPRSKSSRRPGISGKFPRSHSTGHSLVQPCENIDRFTLRLPEHIRRDLVNGQLNRTTSCRFPSEGLVFDGSVRRGYRSGGEGSSRGRNGGEGSSRGRSFGLFDRSGKSDGWVFSMAPPFITRSFSVRSPSKKGTAVKTPFDCLGGAKAGADSEEFPAPQRSPTPVFTVAPPQ